MGSWTAVPVPWGAGVDTKVDEKLVKAPNLAECNNVVFPQPGTLKTRNGYTALNRTKSAGGSISTGKGLVTRANGKELCLLDGADLYSYSAATTNWVNKGDLVTLELTAQDVAQRSTNQTTATVAVLNDVRVSAWEDSADSKVHYQVDNVSTGVVYISDTAVSTGTTAPYGRPQAVSCGSNILLFYYDDADTDLYVKVFSTSAPTTDPAALTLVSDMSTAATYSPPAFVVCETYTQDKIVCAYKRDAAGVQSWRMGVVTSAGAWQTTSGTDHITTLVSGAGSVSDSMAISCGATTAWAAISSGGSTTFARIDYATFNTGTLQFANQGTLTDAVSADSNRLSLVVDLDDESTCHVFSSVASPNPTIEYRTTTISLLGALGFSAIGCTLVGQGFFVRGKAYVLCNYISTVDGTFFLISEDGVPCAVTGAGVSAQTVAAYNAGTPATQYNSDPTDLIATVITRARLNVTKETGIFAEHGVNQVRLDFRATNYSAGKFAEAGDTSYINSGMFWQFDGSTPHESGFLHLAYLTSATGSDTAGNALTLLGQYQALPHFEAANSVGDKQRSAGISITTTLTGTQDTLTYAMRNVAFTQRAYYSKVISRTIADADTVAGDSYYRITSPDPADTALTENEYMQASSGWGASQSVTDYYSDATVITKEQQYSQTELDHVHPGACSMVHEANNRMWLAGMSNAPLRVWGSKYRTQGFGLEFNDSLVIDFPDDGGPITGIGALNGLFVGFKKDRIYVVAGEGPNNAGNGSWSAPQLVNSDVGCTNKHSVVRTPAGLMFASSKGFYLLGQDLQTTYIGAPVELYNSNLTNITAATVLPTVNEVRFLTSTGRMLVYNHFVKQWSTFSGLNGVAAVLWNDVYTFLQSDGTVLYEDSTSTTDGGTAFTTYIRTPWYNTGTQHSMRIRSMQLLGKVVAAHTMTAGARWDYDLTATMDDATFATAGTYNAGDTYQLAVYPSRTKCISVQFDLEATAAIEISGVALDIQYKHGLNRMKSGIKVGT